jgi:hypothetical protein
LVGDEQRVKTSLVALSPVDYVVESRNLLKALGVQLAADINGAAKRGEGKTGLGGFKTMIPKVSNNFSIGTPIDDDDDDDNTTSENSFGEILENYDYGPRRQRRYSKIPRINDPYMNKVRRRIVGNDPKCTVVNIGSTKNGGWKSCQLPPNDDWEGFGLDIGLNKHLKEINIEDSSSSIPNECLLDFFTGFIMNQSIQKLTIYGWPLSAILTALNPFFINNQAFECLNLRTWEKGDLLRMDSSLRLFRSMKEFSLDEKTGNVQMVSYRL